MDIMDADQDRSLELSSYLSDRMPQEARRAFEARMEADAALAAEVAMLRAARGVAAADVVAASASETEREAEWRKISARLDRPAPQARAANDNRAGWLPKLAQAAAIAAVSVFLWEFAAAPAFRDADAPRYEPVSERASGEELQAIFAETATAADIAALLRRTGGEIVGGPSALGVFRVAYDDAAARDAAIAVLGADPLVISAAR